MSYKKYNDYELISMIRENDENSYDLLFQKYSPIIRKIAFDYYHAYSSYGYDLDDFVQEGYVAFQKSLNKYNEKKDVLFYTFVVLCIHRNLISFCNSISNEKKNISSTRFVSLDDIILHTDDNACSYLDEKEIYHMIWDFIYQYSIEETCVFELRWNHFTFNEISILLELPVRRCHGIFHKILNNLRKEIKEVL